MRRIITPLLFLCSVTAMADTVSLGFSDNKQANPERTHGAILTYAHTPHHWAWDNQGTWFNRADVAIAGSVAHWRTRSANTIAGSRKTLTTAALAPELTLDIHRSQTVTPYFSLSVGPAYISTTIFGDRRLGEHWLFQDIAGLGVRWANWRASLNYLHYSNANLATYNAGVDIKWLLRVGYAL